MRTSRLRFAVLAVLLSFAAVAAKAGAEPRKATPPPTPVPPHGSPSPFPTVLATPADHTHPPPVAAGTSDDTGFPAPTR